MTFVPTFTATIHLGLKHRPTGEVTDRTVAVSALQRYVDSVGLCVSVKDVQYVYTNGSEPGLEVGLINYPRFPSSQPEIKARAISIARALLRVCRQERVSVVMPDETVMITNCAHASQKPIGHRQIAGVERVVFQCQDCLSELVYQEPREESE